MSDPVYIPKDAAVMSDLRILVGGLPNTGKSTVAALFAQFLRQRGFAEVTLIDDEPYDFDKLAACEMSLRDKCPNIVIETLLIRRGAHPGDSASGDPASSTAAYKIATKKIRELELRLAAETYQPVEGWRRSDTGRRLYCRDLAVVTDENGEPCGPWLRVCQEYPGHWVWAFYLDYASSKVASGDALTAWDAMQAAEAAYAHRKSEQK
jgi:hypothetical protein